MGSKHVFDVAAVFAQALQNHQAGNLRLAEQLYQQILQVTPDHADAHHLLGVLAFQLGRYDQAVTRIRHALTLNPWADIYYSNLGAAHEALGQMAEALASFQQFLSLQPSLPEAYNAVGNALLKLGRLQEALTHLRHALSLRPAFPEALNNLGNALLLMGQPDQALANYRHALRLKPDYPDPWNNAGAVLIDQGKPGEAVTHLQQALDLRPDYPEAYNNLGNAFKEQGELDKAEANYREAVRLRPAYADAHYNLALLLELQGRVEESIVAHRQVIALQPDNARFHSGLLLPLNYLAEVTPQALFEEHRRWAARHAAPLTSAAPPPTNDRTPERLLRVGYVSPDLHEHPVAFFLEPVLVSMDRSRFHVTCYSGVARPDAMTLRLRGLADAWRDIAGLPDADVAESIRADRIDILVDLAGHTAGRRLLVFARRPVPVQVTHFGYPNTTGLAAMDYRISDPYADPPGQTEAFHTEELVRLPEVAWCYQPSPAPEVGPLPALGAGHLTFGSLNKLAKVTPQSIALWARLLRAVPDSCLLLLTGAGSQTDQRLLEQFRSSGIDGERLQLLGRLPRDRYLEVYQRIDIVLDPFPYNGGVTTCDAFWMGVPVITLSGDTYVSRQGVSLLSNLDLRDWIAETPEDYVALGVRRAQDLEELGRLRSGLRQRMRRSPLCDGKRFTRRLEEAYRLMWRRWCAKSV
jgi:predicted O-linked N-acetylglucosamine transferase (SPINDLY family)